MTIFCGSDLDRIPISNLPGLIGITIRSPSLDRIRSFSFLIISKECVVDQQRQTKSLVESEAKFAFICLLNGAFLYSVKKVCDENVRQIASDERSREEHAACKLNA
jgi:hypothetical protein